MIRGEGDIPNCEMLYPEFINKKIDYLKLIKRGKLPLQVGNWLI